MLVDFKTDFSLQRCGIKIPEGVAKLKEIGCKYAAITDYSSISGVVDFYEIAKEQGIKPILGITFELADGNIICLARNLKGWKMLLQLVSDLENLTLNKIIQSCDNLLIILGGMNSILFNLSPDIRRNAIKKILHKTHLFLGASAREYKSNLLNRSIVDELSDEYSVPIVELSECYYLEKEDAKNHQIQLSSYCGSLAAVSRPENKLEQFTGSATFEILPLKSVYSQNNQIVASLCEDYEILSTPIIPHFPCPSNYTANDWLLVQCKQKIQSKGLNAVYKNRLNREYSVISQADLSAYFLILQDIVQWCNDQGWLTSWGRGSAGGCLISYLLGITKIDPIKFGLIFERFYNEARTKELPDIDIDVPKFKRETIIQYIKDKYGDDKVSQMATFGKLKGKNAIRDVLRLTNACSTDEINTISKAIPEEPKVAAKMEGLGYDSLLLYTLNEEPETIERFAKLKDGELVGDFAKPFKQALRLEGTNKTLGCHASGIILSDLPITEYCAIITGAKDTRITAWDMYGCAKAGLVKLDILGLLTLDKLMMMND